MIEVVKAVNDLVAQGGWLAVLILVLIAGFRGWWKFGPDFNDMRKDRDFWRDTAIGFMRVGDKATDVAAQTIRRVK